jgi:hypothetical protein
MSSDGSTSDTAQNNRYTSVASRDAAEKRLDQIPQNAEFLKYSCGPAAGGEIHPTDSASEFEIRKPTGITFRKTRKEVVGLLTECRSLPIQDSSKSVHTVTDQGADR